MIFMGNRFHDRMCYWRFSPLEYLLLERAPLFMCYERAFHSLYALWTSIPFSVCVIGECSLQCMCYGKGLLQCICYGVCFYRITDSIVASLDSAEL